MARSKSYQREDILEKITAAFIAKGYEATSMSELMTVTGLNKKSLYNEFGNKEALFLTVLTDFVKQESKKSRPILTQQPYGLKNIRTFFDSLFEGFGESGCLLTISLNEAQLLSPSALKSLNSTLKHLEEGFYLNLINLDNLQEQEAKMFARNILALMQGYSSLNRSSAFRNENQESIVQLLLWLEQKI